MKGIKCVLRNNTAKLLECVNDATNIFFLTLTFLRRFHLRRSFNNIEVKREEANFVDLSYVYLLQSFVLNLLNNSRYDDAVTSRYRCVREQLLKILLFGKIWDPWSNAEDPIFRRWTNLPLISDCHKFFLQFRTILH